MLTETDDLARALDDAAITWPELRADRGALLRKLVDAGHQSIRDRDAVRALIARTAGVATGLYPPGARAALLAEWPE